MEVAVLGPLEVRSLGPRSALGGTKQRAVLAMLALRVGQVVSTDFLVDGLWESPPAGSINVVQSYVSRLRKTLGSAVSDSRIQIIRRRPGYLLDLDPDLVDLHRFERLTREGVAALPGSPARAASVLRDALALWRGSPLAEFATEPFAALEIPRLDEQWLAAATARVEADLALGRHAALVAELEDLTSRYPLHEGLQAQLMLSLYRSERQAEALQVYQRFRRVFADDLGIDPGRALRDLEHSILGHDPELDWKPPLIARAPVASGAGHPPAIGTHATLLDRAPEAWNVPPRSPRFTGRSDLLNAVHQRLNETHATLSVLALYGMGGVGKTQLAVEYAHRHAAEYDAVWWVEAEQPMFIPGQLAALAEQLGASHQGTVAGTVRQLLAELTRRSRWLIIFDNAEHPADIAHYRPAGAGHILVTSRYPSWGALGDRIEVDVLGRADTVGLLRGWVRGMSVDEATLLAAELGDLPLAAAQAAAYLERSGMTAAEYLRRFRDQRAVLLARGEVLGYQGTVDTAWLPALERLRVEEPAAVALLEHAALLAPEPIPIGWFTEHPELLGPPLSEVMTLT